MVLFHSVDMVVNKALMFFCVGGVEEGEMGMATKASSLLALSGSESASQFSFSQLAKSDSQRAEIFH